MVLLAPPVGCRRSPVVFVLFFFLSVVGTTSQEVAWHEYVNPPKTSIRKGPRFKMLGVEMDNAT